MASAKTGAEPEGAGDGAGTGAESRYHLLPDDPISGSGGLDADAFKVHTAFAKTLKGLIEQSTEKLDGRGFVIGISGPWGSGKSTVIRILQDLLDGECNPRYEGEPAAPGEGRQHRARPQSAARDSEITGAAAWASQHATADCPSREEGGSGRPQIPPPFWERIRRFARCAWACFVDFLRPYEEADMESIDDRTPRRTPFVVLDVSQFSDDSLRRWILFQIESQLSSPPAVPGFNKYKYNRRSLRENLEWSEQATRPRGWAFWTVVGIMVAAVALAVVPWPARSGPIGWAVRWLHHALTRPFSGTLALFVLLGGFFAILARTFPTVTAVRNVTFSPERFGYIFEDMVRKAARATREGSGRLILCFDNIDRAPADVTILILQTIRSYLGHAGCVCLVPFDQEALVEAAAPVAGPGREAGDWAAARACC